MAALCDLHTHSCFSDGKNTPTELVEMAERIGLSAIALCDHNTVMGLPEFVAAASDKNVEAIAGIEFSVDYNAKELHILALYVPMQKFGEYTALLDKTRKNKEESNKRLIKSLCKAGYMLDYDKILATSINGGLNRVHVANALVEIGAVSSVNEAFEKLLSEEIGHYIPPQRMDAFEVIKFILDTGAVPVLAHPLLNLSVDELRVFLEKASKCGLVGMETDYSEYNSEEIEISKAIAYEFGLLCSGGSDFHGDNKPYIKLSVGRGNLSIPFEYAQKLKARAKA